MRQPLGVSPRRLYRLHHYRSGRPLLPLVEVHLGSCPTFSATMAEVASARRSRPTHSRSSPPVVLWDSEMPLGRSEEFLRQSQLQALTAQYWFAPYWNPSTVSPYTHYLMECPGSRCICDERCMVDRKWRYTHTICNFGGNIHHRRVACCTEYTLEPGAPRSTLCRTRNRYSADLSFLQLVGGSARLRLLLHTESGRRDPRPYGHPTTASKPQWQSSRL